MDIPTHLLHTPSHEWLSPLGEGIYAVGISHAGQDMLGDIVFCGEAALGKVLAAGDTCALVESVKAASDVHMPIAGEVIAFNESIMDDPTVLNSSAYDTWIIKIKTIGSPDLTPLLSAAQYEQQL